MKVRLKLAALATYLCTTLFQFHEGPIKTKYAADSVVFRALFQFHEGPIKTCLTLPPCRTKFVSIP